MIYNLHIRLGLSTIIFSQLEAKMTSIARGSLSLYFTTPSVFLTLGWIERVKAIVGGGTVLQSVGTWESTDENTFIFRYSFFDGFGDLEAILDTFCLYLESESQEAGFLTLRIGLKVADVLHPTSDGAQHLKDVIWAYFAGDLPSRVEDWDASLEAEDDESEAWLDKVHEDREAAELEARID
jgi:hypothetical protein